MGRNGSAIPSTSRGSFLVPAMKLLRNLSVSFTRASLSNLRTRYVYIENIFILSRPVIEISFTGTTHIESYSEPGSGLRRGALAAAAPLTSWKTYLFRAFAPASVGARC